MKRMRQGCRRSCWAIVVLACVAMAPAQARERNGAAPVQGVITRIVDGDSLWLQPTEGAAIEVRLRDIDAPEICQDWGPEARQALEEYALGKPATLRVAARDSYGRSVGLVTVDGTSLGQRMVAEGHAFSVRTRWDRGPLVKEERIAQALRRGMHASGKTLVRPKEFRKLNGPCRKP